ncbi:MAG: hypothetical protein Q4A07_01680 [Coriobacteriales bacterium]|nr:hypothetical protein [Coriobacteriales bacterium]
MRSARIKTLTIVASMALAAALALTACGGSSPKDEKSPAASASGSSESETVPAKVEETDPTIVNYDLKDIWIGVDGKAMMYYYRGADQKSGAFLIYHTDDNTYERYLGKMETPTENQVRITDDESGKSFAFEIESTDDDGTITIRFEDGKTTRLSPSTIDEIGNMLDSIDTYATRRE